MRQQPLVSVVTPSLNQGAYIEETILSVLEQDYASVEYIVVDGRSTDNTLEILERYRDRLQYVSEPDDGQSDAINKGLGLASGEILAYLNSDDCYLPGAIQAVVDHLSTRPECGLCYGDCQVIGPEREYVGLMKAPAPNVHRLIHRAEFIPQPSSFWRREALKQVGDFDVALSYAMDYDFFVRVGQSFPMCRLSRPLAVFRLHSASKTVSGEERHWQEALLVSRRYGSGWHSPYYLWRVLRHRGLCMLPQSIQMRVRRWLARPQDGALV